jgi:succinoglycan biosynthesis transport protein ExoP
MDASATNLPVQLDDGPEYVPEYRAHTAISIPEALETLRRGWRIPVFGCLIGLVAGVTYFVLAQAPYKSSARILIDRSMNRYLQTNKITDQPTFDDPEVASQVYVLSSDSVVLPVVRKLKLAHDGEFVSPQNLGGLTILDPFAKLKEILRSAFGWHADAATSERMAVDAVLKRLTVSREDVANVISVTVESQDPNKAADIANGLADTYISTTLDAKLQSTRVVGQWLRDRLADLKAQVSEAERALQDYRTANNLPADSVGSQSNVALAGLRAQLTSASIATAEAKERLDLIQRADIEGIMTAVGVDALLNNSRSGAINFALTNSELVKLRGQYRDLAARQMELEARVGPKHAAVLKLQGQIAGLRTAIQAEEKRIADVYVNEYQIAKTRESELAARLAQSTGDTVADRMRELENSAETLRDLYSSFLQKFNEISTSQAETLPVQNARIITRATPPLYKSSKKALAVLAGSTILGLLLGGAAVMAREWAADVFRTTKTVEQLSERKCVVLPMVEAKSALVEEFVLDAPYSRFTETFRNIKTLIDAAPNGHRAKVIGVVSSLPEEGKTIVAAHLASLITSSGARTLVMDTDLHLRKLTAALAPNTREGFLDALEDPTRLSELVVKRQRSGLDVLPSVSPTRIPNAAELLGSHEMETLLVAARTCYDYIIIEIAPIMSVVDVKTIERFIDAFVFVVEWGQTKRSVVMDALSEAHVICDRLVGMILNKADPDALRHIESYKGNKFRHYYQD